MRDFITYSEGSGEASGVALPGRNQTVRALMQRPEELSMDRVLVCAECATGCSKQGGGSAKCRALINCCRRLWRGRRRRARSCLMFRLPSRGVRSPRAPRGREYQIDVESILANAAGERPDLLAIDVILFV